MLWADNHKDVWVFVHEVVISCILNKGGAEENDVVKLPPEWASKLVYKVLCLPEFVGPTMRALKGSFLGSIYYTYVFEFTNQSLKRYRLQLLVHDIHL